MLNKIYAFIMAIIAFFSSLFGIGNYGKVNTYYDVPYGSGAREVYDLVIPKGAKGETNLILLIHGGAWIGGDKKDSRDSLVSQAANGYCAAAINYTFISDKTDISFILDEITMALKAIKGKGSEIGISINKAMLYGHSAGGNLSLLYAYSRAEEAPVKPVAVFGMSAPTDLTDVQSYIDGDFEEDSACSLFSMACGFRFTKENLEEAKPYLAKVSPVTYVSSSCVPTVLAHGQRDTTVSFSQSEKLDALLTQYGVKHEFVVFPNSGHDLADDPGQSDRVYSLISEYANEYLK
ncbi:MAG: alpha/beta hydrolase [Clostridia bacterium]|nr:alpha/beta hydrolase [Clostridia bacterium]